MNRRSLNKSQLKTLPIVGGLLFLLTLSAGAADREVHRLRIDGVINPVSTKFILDGIDRAEEQKAEALIIELDTPGGLLEATRNIVQRFLAAEVPIIVYVSPDGARAGSAGVFITLAAHIAVMAPGTNIGAAHPVSIGGGGFPGQQSDTTGQNIMGDKVTNDAAALIRSIAETRGRNVDWAEKAVRTSDAITALEAASQNVIDYISPTLDSLLTQADGRLVKLKSGEKTLQLQNAKIITYEMTWREKLFDKISDPNLAYLFMMAGIYGILFELYNPGAVLPGVVGGLGLLLAFFAFQALPVNAVGVLLILFGVVLLIMEIKVTSYGMLTVAGAGSLFLGSLMLFDASIPAIKVSLSLIIPTVLVTTAFVLFALGMGIKAQKRKIETGTEGLIGMEGETLEKFDSIGDAFPCIGQVLVNGEYWRASSVQRLEKSARIKVVAVDGMTLKVEALKI